MVYRGEGGGGIGVTDRNTQLVKNLTEPSDLSLHLIARLLPEPFCFSLLKRHGRRFLQRRHTTIAYPRMRSSNVLNQMRWSDQISHSPACGIERFPGRADGKSAFIQLGGQGGDAREGDVVESVVDFVGEDDNVVLYGEGADAFEFFFGHDFADGVVSVKS